MNWTRAEEVPVLSITYYYWGRNEKRFLSITYAVGPWRINYNHWSRAVYIYNIDGVKRIVWPLPFVNRKFKR